MAKAITEYAAWWGAILATLVFLWDIYKWRKAGPQVVIEVGCDQSIVGSPKHKGKKFVLVSANNRGERPTTLTGLGLRWYSSKRERRRRNAEKSFAVIAETSQALPFHLQPGELWQGLFDQTEDVATMARDGLLFCEVYCTHTDRAPAAQLHARPPGASERKREI